MADIGRLSVILSANPGPLEQGLQGAMGTLRGFASKAAGVASSYGSVFGQISARLSNMGGGEAAKGFGQMLAGIGGGLATAAVGIATGNYLALGAALDQAGVAMLTFARQSLEALSTQNKMARTFGIGVEEMQRFSGAALMTGISVQQLQDGLQGFQRRMGEMASGTHRGQAIAGFVGQLGVNMQQFQGAGLRQQFAMVQEGLGRIHDPALRASLAFRIMGAEAQSLRPLLSRSAAEMATLEANAQALGMVRTAGEMARVTEAMRSMKEAGAYVESIFSGIGAEMAMAIVPMVTEFNAAIKLMIMEFQPLIAMTREFFGWWTANMTGLGMVSAFLVAFNVIRPALQALQATLVAIRGPQQRITEASVPTALVRPAMRPQQHLAGLAEKGSVEAVKAINEFIMGIGAEDATEANTAATQANTEALAALAVQGAPAPAGFNLGGGGGG